MHSTSRSKPPSPAAKRSTYRHGNLREALVTEAVKMMNESDDASFTLREVAQRIHVSHTAAYRHFPNKGALLAELANRGFSLLADEMRQALEQAVDSNDLVRRQALAYLRTATTHTAYFRCMFGPRKYGPEHAAAVDASCDVCYDLLVQSAERVCAARGPQGPDAQELSLTLWSAIHGLANLAIDGQLHDHVPELNHSVLESLAQQISTHLLRGLHPHRERKVRKKGSDANDAG